VVPSGEPDQRFQEPALWDNRMGTAGKAGCCFLWRFSALRQNSGVYVHRKAVAKPVCQGIITRAASNGILRAPPLLRQLAVPSLRRTVTARRQLEPPQDNVDQSGPSRHRPVAMIGVRNTASGRN
jgi:hypothetical protein